MNSIEKLAQEFANFPGIGERQAKRFVYFLLRVPKEKRNNLAYLINQVSETVSECQMCFRYFEGKGSICGDCINPAKDKSTLMVLEKDADYEGMKKSGAYNGLYFLLGGNIPIVEKNTNQRVRMNQLLDRIKTDINKNNLSEVILAFSASRDGDHTADIVRENIQKNFGTELKITTLGKGLSTGTEIEYSDTDTLSNALKSRH